MRVNAQGVTASNVHWFNICTPFYTLYFKLVEYIFALKGENDWNSTPPGVPMDTHLTDNS